MNFNAMSDAEIRQYAAELASAATGHPAGWYANSAALSAQNGKVGMLRHENYGGVSFDPLANIEEAAQSRLVRAQSCFRW